MPKDDVFHRRGVLFAMKINRIEFGECQAVGNVTMKAIHSGPVVGGGSSRCNQGGFVMIAAMLLLVGLMAVSITIAKRTLHNTNQTRRGYHEARAFYLAEGGTEWAADWLYSVLLVNPNPAQEALNAVSGPQVPGFQFFELTVTKQPLILGGHITQGQFSGLTADIQPYLIRSRAGHANSSVQEVVEITVNQEAIGMHQFGIYYDGDLEIFPNYPLDYNGRIHTNGNLYVGSSNVLNIDGVVTAAGSVYNIPKDETRSYNGKARLKNQSGQWKDLSYDSRHANWVTLSLTDWQERLMDASHNAARLPVPLPAPSRSIEIIKRGLAGDSEELLEKRFYYKAGLRILDGAASDSAGMVMIPAGVITSSPFFDCREQRNLTMYNVDVAALIAAGLVPGNGIIYISYSASSAAVRLRNGQTLPTGGLTFATDNPCYVEGHYNTVSKKPASVLCDAFNVLSTNWDDANATKPLNSRIAFATTVNTCVVAGNAITSNGHYNGGAENLIRLHEKWVGHELTYHGSLVCLWESEIATGDFTSECYYEAHRDWGFDAALLDPAFWPRNALSLNRVARGIWKSF